ncbi:hypothetical protein ACFE04_003810 [Oxalis oulophora]
MSIASLLLVAFFVTTSNGLSSDYLPFRSETSLRATIAHDTPLGVKCLSWRFGAETNNIRGWVSAPEECHYQIGYYLYGQQYKEDSKLVIDEAISYAKNLTVAKNGKDVWILDIDETSLSNLPAFAQQYGYKRYRKNATKSETPALPETLKLYNKLLSLGIKTIFLSGRPNIEKRNATIANLLSAGYHNWTKLILRDMVIYDEKKSALEYKSSVRKLLEEKSGYKIVGNIGDQWSDLLGSNQGIRTFKLPNPIYYVA